MLDELLARAGDPASDVCLREAVADHVATPVTSARRGDRRQMGRVAVGPSPAETPGPHPAYRHFAGDRP